MASWDEEKPRHGILDMKQCDIYYPDDHHYTDPDDPNHNWNNMQGTDLNLPYGLSSRLPNPHPFTFNVEMSTVDEEGLIRNRSYRPTSPFARKKSHTRRLRWSDGSGRGEVALANDPADKTFPTSGEKDRDYVIRLIKAMMAMSKAQDSLAVKQQWAKNIKEKISPTVVFTAWQILVSPVLAAVFKNIHGTQGCLFFNFRRAAKGDNATVSHSPPSGNTITSRIAFNRSARLSRFGNP